MVGLQRAAGNQHLRALRARLCHEKFQFTSLVATEGKTGLVVAFDQNSWAAQCFRKTRELLDRRRQMSELQTRNLFHTYAPSCCFVLVFPCERITSSTRGIISEYSLYQTGFGA